MLFTTRWRKRVRPAAPPSARLHAPTLDLHLLVLLHSQPQTLPFFLLFLSLLLFLLLPTTLLRSSRRLLQYPNPSTCHSRPGRRRLALSCCSSRPPLFRCGLAGTSPPSRLLRLLFSSRLRRCGGEGGGSRRGGGGRRVPTDGLLLPPSLRTFPPHTVPTPSAGRSAWETKGGVAQILGETTGGFLRARVPSTSTNDHAMLRASN